MIKSELYALNIVKIARYQALVQIPIPEPEGPIWTLLAIYNYFGNFLLLLAPTGALCVKIPSRAWL